MRLARLALAAACAASAVAWACGVCVDDKVAATYDHAVVTRAVARHHVVVFAEAQGPADAATTVRGLRAAAARVRGVEPASVRAAAAPLALSFALDPRVASPEQALAAVERGAAIPGLRLGLLRVAR